MGPSPLEVFSEVFILKGFKCCVLEQDYLLDKSKASWSNSFMDSNLHFFLGLAADALALSIFRMSFLIEARSFRVGTFSKSFFLPSSIGGVL